jgi:hypothetical protein
MFATLLFVALKTDLERQYLFPSGQGFLRGKSGILPHDKTRRKPL